MAETNPAPHTGAPARVEHRISVPADVSMVELLGLRDEVLKDPLKQDYFDIVDRLDADAALPNLAQWQAERRAGGQPLTLQ